MRFRARKSIKHDSVEYALKERYFITICVRMKQTFLGKTKGQDIEKSELGKIVEEVLGNINRRYDNALITDYVIMPNHIHMIVDMSSINARQANIGKKPSISDIIRDFKSYTTHLYNQRHPAEMFTLWQRGFHDYRIKNNEKLELIREYIKNNPKNWATDKFYFE